MKNNRRKSPIIRILSLTALIIFLVVVYFVFFFTGYKTITMDENNDYIVNPDRGAYSQIDTSQASIIKDYYNGEQGMEFRLVLIAFDLNDYPNTEIIPEEKINELKNALDIAREYGMGVIFRAGYFFSGDEEYLEPDEFETVCLHEKQIADVINEYTDVVVCVQAGFLGPYGEWHSSIHMEDETEGMKNYLYLLKIMLEDIDEDISINIRRPLFIREAINEGIDCERVGFFNDGMFGTETDIGTYTEEGYDRDDELRWLKENINTPYNGGEFPYVTEFSVAKNAIKELDKMQVTYLNQYYNYEVWEDWFNTSYFGENAADYIYNHLGYRLSFSKIKIPELLLKHTPSKISGVISNSGFAKTSESYDMYLAIEYNNEIQYISVDYAYSSKDEILFNTKMENDLLPEDPTENSVIKMGIVFSKSEDMDTKYCIEFANDEVNYIEGINYFVEYIYAEKKWEVLN